jgi:glycosyltransferase involved in cell wall biosynthesis
MRVLTLSTYPIAVPRHGGQQRLHHIVKAYAAAGHQTRSIGVLGSSQFEPEDGFLPLPPVERMSKLISNPFLMEDWAIGQLAAKDDSFHQALCGKIGDVPDLIHVEQPWLFAFAHRYARQLKAGKARVVYGSANVEHELKRRIVSGYMGAAHAEECARLVLQCETEAAAKADLIVATSQSDLTWLKKHASTEVVLAPNGVAERTSSMRGIEEANRITLHAKTALYCASSHPPNTHGFYDIFGRGIGFLTPDERIVVAGSAGASIKADPRFARTPGLAQHFVDAGEVSEECLQGLLETCHAIVLPITHGGGTNLKTAEAIWAGRWVVATSVGMRGFEDFIATRGLNVCSDPTVFRETTRKVMGSPPLRLSAAEKLTRRSVLWESALKLLVDRTGALAGAKS